LRKLPSQIENNHAASRRLPRRFFSGPQLYHLTLKQITPIDGLGDAHGIHIA
jgi:hypothetical protein